MKKIVALSIVCLASAPALAQTCNSLWVYQPYKSCPAVSNGPDMSQSTPLGAPHQAESGFIKGTTQDKACNDVRLKFERNEATRAIRATATPNGEDSRRIAWDQTYNYKCMVQENAHPYRSVPNRECGVEPKWMAEDVGKSLAGLNGTPICLSCDDQQAPKARLACLKATIEQVIVPKEVAIRPEQLAAVTASLEKISKFQKEVPNALGIDETVLLGELKEKVSKAAGEQH